jgi:glycosyltransferase involved in cell wall biosynthesis
MSRTAPFGSDFAQTVSVVVATYNGERFLPLQLDSLLRQTRRPDEIVISDDNSSDGTMRIVEAFAATSPVPTRILRNVPGLGFGDNFLAAAQTATSDVIAFCDQDDVWHPEKLERCMAAFAAPAVTLVTHRARLIDSDGNPIGAFDQGITQSVTRPPLSYDLWGTFFGFSILCRRDILTVSRDVARFRDYIDPTKRIAHDRWVTFLAQVLGNVVALDARLVDYRQHQTNLYGAGKTKGASEDRARLVAKAADYLAATRRMAEIIDELDPASEALFPAFDRRAARRFVDRALRQLEARSRTYALHPIAAIGQIGLAACSGAYLGANDRRMRLRSIARDLQIATMPRTA